MHFLKKIFKMIFIILIIALISFCGYRYYKLKKEGKLDEVFAKNVQNINDSSNSQDLVSSDSSTSNSDGGSEDDEKSSSTDGKYVVEEKNYDGYYNQFNFDNRLLLYEGTQYKKGAKEALDFLILDADDPMFSKPTIVFENFSGLKANEITANNLEEYKEVLKAAQNSLDESTYTFSFEYNKLKTYVNKIIITKN